MLHATDEGNPIGIQLALFYLAGGSTRPPNNNSFGVRIQILNQSQPINKTANELHGGVHLQTLTG